MVELKVGFPEMRLSPDLVARLRRETAVSDTGPPNGSELPDQNGHSPLTPSPFGAMDGVNGEPPGYRGFASSYDGRVQQDCYQNGAPHHDRVFAPATQSDDAMQHFQETMQTFLQTQQEVMAAYLAHPSAIFWSHRTWTKMNRFSFRLTDATIHRIGRPSHLSSTHRTSSQA